MSRLQADVIAFIHNAIQSQPRINKAWLVHEFISQKGDLPAGEYDREFYREGAYYAVSNAAGKAIKKVGDIDPDESPQLTLPGYDKLQVAYSVKNEAGEVELVQTHLIPDQPLLDRADEYDVMSAGLRKHAEELRSFVERRSQSSFAV